MLVALEHGPNFQEPHDECYGPVPGSIPIHIFSVLTGRFYPYHFIGLCNFIPIILYDSVAFVTTILYDCADRITSFMGRT